LAFAVVTFLAGHIAVILAGATWSRIDLAQHHAE
jgi:hypothetical protein